MFTFPSNYAIDIYGPRKGVLFGIGSTALGMSIKCLINVDFYLCILGQVFAAIGQPFIVNAPAKVAAVWFGTNERVIAITICVAAQAIGAAIGFVLPTIWVQPDDAGEVFKEHLLTSLIVQAAIGIALFLMILLFFKDKPALPPSPSAFQLIDKPG